MDPVIRLLGVRADPLTVDGVVEAVRDPRAGGLAVFVGTVRREDGGRAVDRLDYSSHPSVEAEFRAIAEKVVASHALIGLAALHRVGELVIGDVAVVVATSAIHRGEALAACRRLIDDLKHGLPIWKHQIFADGSEEWVGLE